MGKLSATCEYVQDGDTFRTAMKNWIRLARYDAPEEGKPNFEEAKQLLSNFILNKEIEYEQVGMSYNRIVAEVWQANININDVMINSDYHRISYLRPTNIVDVAKVGDSDRKMLVTEVTLENTGEKTGVVSHGYAS